MINLYNLQRAVTTSNKVARRNCQFYWKGTTNKNQEAKRLYWIEDYWKDTDNVEEGKKVILFGTVYYVIKRSVAVSWPSTTFYDFKLYIRDSEVF